jgi:hypothetical protein
MKLTSQSEELLRDGLSIHDLPKTFKETVDVCVQLKIRYLWIGKWYMYEMHVRHTLTLYLRLCR